jgi:hypothetical protein
VLDPRAVPLWDTYTGQPAETPRTFLDDPNMRATITVEDEDRGSLHRAAERRGRFKPRPAPILRPDGRRQRCQADEIGPGVATCWQEAHVRWDRPTVGAFALCSEHAELADEIADDIEKGVLDEDADEYDREARDIFQRIREERDRREVERTRAEDEKANAAIRAATEKASRAAWLKNLRTNDPVNIAKRKAKAAAKWRRYRARVRREDPEHYEEWKAKMRVVSAAARAREKIAAGKPLTEREQAALEARGG